MPSITFRAKIKEQRYSDGVLYQRWIQRPAKFQRSHCDMQAFRTHPKYGAYANSDIFPSLLNRELDARGIGERIVLETADGLATLPDGITIENGFLATVTITL